jgi:pantothenate kinase
LSPPSQQWTVQAFEELDENNMISEEFKVDEIHSWYGPLMRSVAIYALHCASHVELSARYLP